MPHWRFCFRSILDEAPGWITMGEIREEARRRRYGLGNQRPSIPCIKNYLIERIRRREIIGLLGARGSAYFVTVVHYARGDGWEGGPRPPQAHSSPVRNRVLIEEFNRSVCDALQLGNEIPLPFNRTSRGVPRMPGEVPTGPIRAEPLHIFESFAPTDTTRFAENVQQILSRVDAIDDTGHISRRIPSNLRGYLSAEDISDAVRQLIPILKGKARERANRGPISLEGQFLQRMEEKEQAESNE